MLPMNLFLLTTITENLNESLGLLAIGMMTIFIMLGLVVLLGNGLILFVNRFLSEEKLEHASTTTTSPIQAPLKTFSPSALSAIVAAVEITTRGKGSITQIKKI